MGASDMAYGGDRPVEPAVQTWARVVVDARGVLTEWSAAAERLLGYVASDVVGRPAAVLMATADEADEAEGPAPGDKGDEGEEGAAILLRHRDGRTVSCRLSVHPEDGDGAGPRWAVMLAPAGTSSAREIDRAFLEALFTRSPVGLFVFDPELRLLKFNAAAEGMQGTPTETAVGRRPTEVWPDFGAEPTERVMKQVLESGQPVISFEKRGRPPGDPGQEHIYSVSAFRLEDAHGRILGVADAVVDVTDRHRAQERLALLAEAGARIGTTLDVVRTAQELADLAVPRLADTAAIEVLEPTLLGGEITPGPVAGDVVLRRAASRSRRKEVPPGVYEVGEVSTFPFAGPFTRALRDLRPLLVSRLGPDSEWIRADPVRGRRMLEEKVHSLMLIPLVVRDLPLGLAAFYRWGELGPFREDDLTLATELGRRTSVCLDNARQYVRERDALLSLQRSLLPHELPDQIGVEAAHQYVHAGSGGDWVDVIPLSGARVALVAGRAAGHGVHAAAAMGRLRAAVHTLSDLDLEPDELLARVDDLVFRLAGDDSRAGAGGRADTGADKDADVEARPGPGHGDGVGSGHVDGIGSECLYLVYDPVSRRCTMAGAGHSRLVVRYPNGSVTTLEPPAAEPLGRPGPSFGKAELELPEGALLTLHTPGLLQAYEDRAAGLTRLEGLLARPPDSLSETCRLLTDSLLPEQPPEDAAVLVARTHALGEDRVAAWDLPSDPAVVSTARSLVAHQLTSWGLEEEAFTTELIVSELVTNAIRYASAPIRLRMIRDRTLTCEVSDGSSTAPRVRHPRATDEGGRGLLLVAQFAERWGARYTAEGKTVWAEQKIDGAPDDLV
ncbi:SpoIIE family protein phosphatase [Streptomyces inhibens]|nr:SpoIIE family protein phosphatase [Streptomyces inhibens]